MMNTSIVHDDDRVAAWVGVHVIKENIENSSPVHAHVRTSRCSTPSNEMAGKTWNLTGCVALCIKSEQRT